MKPLTLSFVVAMGLFAIGCSASPEDESGPAEVEVTRLASTIERTLEVPIAVPADADIGGSIDTLMDTRAAALTLTAQPIVNLDPNGNRCTIMRFDDANGVEQMRREKCDRATDKLRVGALVYRDESGDGKVDQVADSGAASYELFDEDHDGKVDRIVESPEHVKTPIALSDFGANVTITNGGAIASRTRQDRDHDGKFDVESITATTRFRISTMAPASEPTPR